MQLVVLGMHRSGTSVLARLLNLMGAYFGPEGISTQSNQENPKGFWERRDVRKLNDMVLYSVGCDWDNIAKFKLEHLSEKTLLEFKERASRIILDMDAHRPWMLKEPRLCLLFPLWRDLLEVPVCIHIFRNPLEVSSSLYARNKIPSGVGCALWEAYNCSVLTSTEEVPRILISHSMLMQQPLFETKKLYEELIQLGVKGLHIPSDKEILSFVEIDLYRERMSDYDTSEYLNSPQQKLYNSYLQNSVFKKQDKFYLSKGSKIALEHYGQSKDDYRSDIDKAIGLVQAQNAEVVEPLNCLISEQKNQISEQKNQISEQENQISEQKNQISEKQKKIEEKDKAISNAKKLIQCYISSFIELRSNFDALIQCRRWKIGNFLCSFFGLLMFQKKQPVAVLNIKEIISKCLNMKQ